MRAEGTANQSFTSWKLHLLDAISMDPRVTATEFRVAYRLLQHANAETRAIFPSQERIASQIGAKERAVRAAIAGLVEKRWLTISRPNRRLPNLYRFETRNVNAILDRQISLDDARKQERASRGRPVF